MTLADLSIKYTTTSTVVLGLGLIGLIVWIIIIRTPPYAESKSMEKFLSAEFSKIKDLKLSRQYTYLSCLYTDDQLQNRLPFSMNDFWIIQTNFLPHDVIVDNVPKYPTAYHTLFTSLDPHVASEKNVVYNYQYNSLPSTWGNSPLDSHFKLKNGLAHDSWVEVERGPDHTGGYTWFYYMPGTGNWFNLGKTIVFADHHEAFSVAAKDGVKFQDPVNGGRSDQLLLANYFVRKKYDTIQFTQRAESIFKYEIFNLKNKQTDGAAACLPGVQTRGNIECDCSSHLPYLNCMTYGPCGKITLPNI